ncbi:MAG: serine hydrolase domain-containing protein [Acidimicrobiales bacterium]
MGTHLENARVDALLERIAQEVERGVLPACQVAVGLDGEVVLSAALGDATTDTRFSIFSATKALIAATMWQLMADGLVDPLDTVATHFPEFAANGKEAITVEQVMTHTSGFPRAPMGPPRWGDRDWRIEQMAAWRLNWEPGTQFEYHPTSAHWVLAEVIERADRQDYRASVRERVLEPLGLTRLALGVAPEDQGDIAPLVATGEGPSPEELTTVFGVPSYDLGEVTPEALLMFNDPDVRAVGVPGGGGVSTATDLALLYQAFLHNPGDVFDAAVLADGTGHIRCTLPDPILRTPANRTLGLIAAGDDGTSAYRGMGHNVSPRAFGHNGAAGQIVWADPETGLSFVYLTSGIDRNFLREARRISGVASRAALLTKPV